MALSAEQLSLGPIGTNCYVVRDVAGADAAVVDPSGDATELRLHLARRGARCAGILVTHGHVDHLLGVADLAEGTGAPVYMAEGERMLLERPNAMNALPGSTLRAYTPDVLLAGDETIEVAGIAFDVLPVPGHSPAHVAYHSDGHLFSGDVLFAGSVGRTDLPGADWDTLLDSIRRLVETLPPETVVYPGHGPTTTLGEELARNPFLGELRAELTG